MFDCCVDMSCDLSGLVSDVSLGFCCIRCVGFVVPLMKAVGFGMPVPTAGAVAVGTIIFGGWICERLVRLSERTSSFLVPELHLSFASGLAVGSF